MKYTCKRIRDEFIEFFRKREHAFVPSSSLLPADDPTLLFANAGMNQFKDIFLGREKRSYSRAVNSQKCIRAGGKHNDLEDVGHDTYHHTFFEMLGNWSFGDYFKADAIAWAWELLTKVWHLPPRRLHVTVFAGDQAEGLARDDEAAELWRTVTDIDPAHIHFGSKKDNFWEMGEIGPCGPCSEIHYDFTPDCSGGPLVNAGDPKVVEIWNLVFMQFNRDAGGKLSALPARHVDTGMGLERIARILQGVDSNYDIDVFRGLFTATQEMAPAGPYSGQLDDIKDVAYRVVADHARALTFAIADGVMPSNEGRGYVLRRILRRAARYGRQYLGIEGPFLARLVPTVVELMGQDFTEIADRQKQVQQTVRLEEESFGRTLDRGIELFQRQAARLAQSGQKTLPGKLVFDLYATYGFPTDLTQVMAAELGMSVDLAGYEEEMARHRALSGAGEQFKASAIAGLPATDDCAKYSLEPVEANVLGWVVGSEFVDSAELIEGAEAAVVLDKTNFYGEQGGQVGDTGELRFDGGSFHVNNTVLAGQCVLHFGVMNKGMLKPGSTVTCHVAAERMETMRNHTATHLLNWALREVLGEHVSQAGSIVAPDRLRFDFTHGAALSFEEIQRIEKLVNQRVLADQQVSVNVMPLDKARKIPGVRAVFGEKYPDPVRVIAVGVSDPLRQATADTPVEFCGGTHLDRTGRIGLFKIVSEESVAKGVRRLTAVTGMAAVELLQQQEAALRSATQALRARPEELAERISAIQKELRELKKARPAGEAAPAQQAQSVYSSPDGKVKVLSVPFGDGAAMRTMCDVLRQQGAQAILIGGTDEQAGKVTIVAMVSEELAASGKIKAGDWVKAVAGLVDGSGGGKPTLAQAGGKSPQKLAEALQAAGEYARQRLGLAQD